MLAITNPETVKADETEIKPHPGGQTAFLSNPAFEVLFGGAAGPGKTFGLVLDALGLQYEKTPLKKFAIHIPEYRAVLFRRQTTQLSDLIDECKGYYYDLGGQYLSTRKGDPGASFNFPKYYTKGDKVYKTYTSGARIFLCHLNEENDKENHQGFEYQYIGFDELTQFLFSQYIYLFSRARSKIPYLFPRIRSTSNPTGIGLSWVKKRFRPQIDANTIKYFITNPNEEKDVRGLEVPKDFPDALSRCYIPGKLKENLTLKITDPGYAARIKAMGIKMSKALLDSDWDIMEGQFFDMWNSHVHVIKAKDYWTYFEISKFNVLGCIDYGRTMVFSLLLKDSNGNVILFDQLTSVGEVRQVRIERVKNFLIARNLARMENAKFVLTNVKILGDTDLWLKDAFDLANQESPAQMFIDAGIIITKVSKRSTDEKTYRIACNIAVKDALYYEVNELGEVTKQPKFKVYERCDKFIESFPTLPTDEDNPDDIDPKSDEDHWYDSFKMPFMVIRETKLVQVEDAPNWLKELRAVKPTKSFMEL